MFEVFAEHQHIQQGLDKEWVYPVTSLYEINDHQPVYTTLYTQLCALAFLRVVMPARFLLSLHANREPNR